jgi:hypothetical protein
LRLYDRGWINDHYSLVLFNEFNEFLKDRRGQNPAFFIARALWGVLGCCEFQYIVVQHSFTAKMLLHHGASQILKYVVL